MTLSACGWPPAAAASNLPAPAAPAASPAPVAPAQAATAAKAPSSRISVLMISGGSSAVENFQSHLGHLRRLTDLLLARGIPRERIAIFASDGSDPAPDVAMRAAQPEADFWLLEGSRLQAPLKTPVTQVSSSVPGVKLQPATRQAIGAWFKDAATQLRAGDTLFLYVTDHGTRDPNATTDPLANRITLWGKDQVLPARELRAMLDKLNPGVKVVSVMSQCYSGGFARLWDAHSKDGEAHGNFCGYFSSTSDRPAYGCYSETRERDDVGHSFLFLDALRATGSFATAHDAVLASDTTPDVPLRTSDVYLEDKIAQAASQQGKEPAALTEDLLREALRDRAPWEAELQQIDRVAQAFGMLSPRTMAEVTDQTRKLPEISTQLKTYAKTWESALGNMNEANLDRFAGAHAEWADRLTVPKVELLPELERRKFAAELTGELASFTSGERRARLETLRDKKTTAAAVAYRSEVRLGATLRMRALLTSIAGRHYLATKGTQAERQAFASLRGCEQTQLGPAVTGAPAVVTMPVEPFPPADEDVNLAKTVVPAHIGINPGPVPSDRKAALHLGDGAALVKAIFVNTPAQAAGLEVGDIIVGPVGHPFAEPMEIRPWSFLATIDQPQSLEIVRSGKRKTITLVPKAYPLVWPSLPAPPRVATVAPPLPSIPAYRGVLPKTLKGGNGHLLYFWATYCGPCKTSLPEVLAFSRQRGVPVIAITDEEKSKVDAFFKTWKNPFPEIVVSDEDRKAFVAYGVGAVPTFVFIDREGKVRAQTSGYAQIRGLGIEGWGWNGQP